MKKSGFKFFKFFLVLYCIFESNENRDNNCFIKCKYLFDICYFYIVDKIL